MRNSPPNPCCESDVSSFMHIHFYWKFVLYLKARPPPWVVHAPSKFTRDFVQKPRNLLWAATGYERWASATALPSLYS